MLNFCTLFDSNYLDKGLALYRSLEYSCKDFCLYIYCFDDRCFEILRKMNLKHAKLIFYKDIESDDLLAVKPSRSKAEYCWTCTPITIEYSINKFGLEDCTYIDSDLYFYTDPEVVFDEIHHKNADVAIVPHRFCDDSYGKSLEERNGKYCVEFNYFKNNENGRKVLKWWKEKCLEWCYDIPDKDRMGDQKYLNSFPKLFSNVCEIENLGAGVAPWNLKQYDVIGDEYFEIKTNSRFQIVFYHFQNIRYINHSLVNIKSQTNNKKLKYKIYVPYLIEIERIRDELNKEYELNLRDFKITRSSNKVISFLQRNFAALKIKRMSDVINLKKLESYL